MFLKELVASKLRLNYCEERLAIQVSEENHNHLPETLLRLASLFKDDGVGAKFVGTILNDLARSHGKGRKIWSSITKSLFAMLLDFGGPMIYELLNAHPSLIKLTVS